MTERQRAALAELLLFLRPWVEDVNRDATINGADLVDDLCRWVWTNDVTPKALDGIREALEGGGEK